MKTRIAIAHIADSRSDFYSKRQPLAEEEMGKLEWLRQSFNICESGILRSKKDIMEFAERVNTTDSLLLLIHIPIWADPIFALNLCNSIKLPVLLAGNSRPDTSSTVGLLGAGGALHQVGIEHKRIFDLSDEAEQAKILAYIKALAAVKSLKGKTLGIFGGRSLGIFTTCEDPAQCYKTFGVDIEYFDQSEIVEAAKAYADSEVLRTAQWLSDNLKKCEFGGNFNEHTLNKQIRAYLGAKKIVLEKGLDFLGVKCQPELSDGYASHCVAHMLFNATADADGTKETIVHACESDIDGALTMQILKEISGGRPSALLDVRWYNKRKKTWILANCGAIGADFFSNTAKETGLSNISMVPHAFGKGGGGSCAGVVAPQTITLARLCRKDGKYWMAILQGEVEKFDESDLKNTTACFPQALVRMPAGEDFLQVFDSNHLHMVSGDHRSALIEFCNLLGIAHTLWE